MNGKIEKLIGLLQDKAITKQYAYKNVYQVFKDFKSCATKLVNAINENKNLAAHQVDVKMSDVNEFEFHIKMGGELVVFLMQTNIYQIPFSHPLFKSKYISEDKSRSYFGQILVYNFLADTIKYNRQQDSGYLLARFFVNNDMHFYIEGVKNLNFTHPDISRNNVNDDIIEDFILDAVQLSIETDLVTSSFKESFTLTLSEKNEFVSDFVGKKVGFKLGFKMSND